MEKVAAVPKDVLTEDEKKHTRLCILFYAAFRSRGIHWIPERLRSAFEKLAGQDFDKKKQQIESMSVIVDSEHLEAWMVEDLERVEEV